MATTDPSAATGKRVLIVQELNDYEVPMLPDETPEAALQRYLEDGPDQFYARTRERASWVDTRPEEKEVAP